jgi:hypothetical protein
MEQDLIARAGHFAGERLTTTIGGPERSGPDSPAIFSD